MSILHSDPPPYNLATPTAVGTKSNQQTHNSTLPDHEKTLAGAAGSADISGTTAEDALRVWKKRQTVELDRHTRNQHTLTLWRSPLTSARYPRSVDYALTRDDRFPTNTDSRWRCTVDANHCPLEAQRSVERVLHSWLRHKSQNSKCQDPSTCQRRDIHMWIRRHRSKCACHVFGADVEAISRRRMIIDTLTGPGGQYLSARRCG